jgi:hypothetical protein
MESKTLEWFSQSWGGGVPVWILIFRLLAAFALGGAVAWIYRRTHHDEKDAPQSFTATLVMMTIIIAMSTQVIGDNVARAFSLVGALSIVRFRTVVKDTRDTAFVIFSVVVGMAVGAGHLTVAVAGLLVTGIAAFTVRRQEEARKPKPNASETVTLWDSPNTANVQSRLALDDRNSG